MSDNVTEMISSDRSLDYKICFVTRDSLALKSCKVRVVSLPHVCSKLIPIPCMHDNKIYTVYQPSWLLLQAALHVSVGLVNARAFYT